MTWILSTVIRLLLRAAGPLVRRGLPHLAMAVMATLVWLSAVAWPLVTMLLGLLGAVLNLAALVGLIAVVLLMPLIIAADVLSRSPAARNEHSTSAS
ncbi:hypothetical protein [Streptomyces echinatus]|uniref:hypothetical protein n=1 Tax=Streptomyces echinatus TaxID=67293 RepID=UPI0037A42AC3